MKILKQEEVKKILIINLMITLMFTFFFLIITKIQYKNYNQTLNNFISVVVDEIAEKYPDVGEEEIVKSLKSNNYSQSNILKKYGYNEENSYINQLQLDMNKSIKINVALIILFSMGSGVIYIIYIKKQEKTIEEINKYLKEVNNKNYTLKIEENGEGELYKLRNELYKTTILLKESAENSEKEKEQLTNSLADISHQLKTPITSIRIMLDNITDNPNMDEKVKADFIREISKQIDWISSLVISLLKISKFDAGAITFVNKQINVKELVDNVISNLSILLEIKNIEVISKIDENIVLVSDYKWQIEAITNILKNAIEHSKENSKIFINVFNSSVFLEIDIKDEGNGIDKKDLKHIFERFYKVNGSSDNSIGIGLALSKSIIEKSNGYISVESKKNEGTIFKIRYIK